MGQMHMQAAVEENSAVVKKGSCDVQKTAPLHLAASRGDVSALEILLDAGAPINATDGNGFSALEVDSQLSPLLAFDRGYAHE